MIVFGSTDGVPRQHLMRGYIEAITTSEVRGWAFDPLHPDDHVCIIVRGIGIQLGTGLADQQRHDLLVAGIGRGDHGFRIHFEPSIEAVDLGQIEVTARGASASLTLCLATNSDEALLDGLSDADLPVADAGQSPVFILGSARSGTSAVTLALLKSGHYEGFGEGHLLPLALELLHTAHRYYDPHSRDTKEDTLLRRVPVHAFERMVRRGFIQLTRTVFPSGRWVDKSPTVAMIRAAPLMRELWPNARFIFLKRRVLENVLSRKRKFPEDPFKDHFSDWKEVMAAWLEVRHQLAGLAIEVDHLSMARNPTDVAATIADFIALPADSARRFAGSLCEDRPERTSDDPAHVATLEDLGAPPEDLECLVRACADVMHAFGYTFDADYYLAE